MSRSSLQRKGWGLLLPLVTIASLGACGDDDESAGTCEARDDLQEALSGLASTDVVEGGTDALDDAVGDIDDALDELGSDAEDTYGDDVDQVQQALDDLTSAVNDGSANDITSALSNLVSSATDLMNKVAGEC